MVRIRTSVALSSIQNPGPYERVALVGSTSACFALCSSLVRCFHYVLTALIRALGDVFSQKIEGKQRIDLKRSLMTAGYGLAFIGAPRSSCMTTEHKVARQVIAVAAAASAHAGLLVCMHAGPVGHLWYMSLDRMAASRFRVGSPAFITTKIVLDEGLFGPIHVLGFFAYMTIAEGGTLEVCPALAASVLSPPCTSGGLSAAARRHALTAFQPT